MTLTLPTYNELTRALSKTSLKMHASQVHGLISGIICGSSSSEPAWEELITGVKDPKKTHEVLQSLYQVSNQQLKEFLFEFQLVLPTDSAALTDRAEALTLWVQGFLTGLKLANIPIEERSDSEVTEAINDLIEIAKMNYEDVIANEEDEQAYTELVEYVRMVIILIYQDLHAEKAKSSSTSNHLH